MAVAQAQLSSMLSTAKEESKKWTKYNMQQHPPPRACAKGGCYGAMPYNARKARAIRLQTIQGMSEESGPE